MSFFSSKKNPMLLSSNSFGDKQSMDSRSRARYDTADKNLVDWYLIKIKNKFGEDVVWQDAKQWVEENCKGEYVAYYVLFFFKDKEDAAKFKLFWT
jgi:hypothetical protein